MRDLNLKATEYFEAVARLGTVTKAAAEMGLSPSAVSQQIRLLEAQFGVKLFRREKRRLVGENAVQDGQGPSLSLISSLTARTCVAVL